MRRKTKKEKEECGRRNCITAEALLLMRHLVILSHLLCIFI
jgi:hypothetical protein